MIDLKTQSSGADFNHARTRRRRLWRTWDYDQPKLVVVGMNPSVADEGTNDPTVTRCEKRARTLGYGGLVMLNMMDVVEPDSKRLACMPAEERCSKANTNFLLAGLTMACAGKADILCAWGIPGQRHGAVAWFTHNAAREGVTLFCLTTNADGSPTHPLYKPYKTPFQWFAGVDKRNAAQPLKTGA